MSTSAVTAPVTSLVTTRKRSSLWWRPTTTSFVESFNHRSIIKPTGKHQESGISFSMWPVDHSLFQPLDNCRESPLQLFFAVFMTACQTDKQQTCDLLLSRPWLEIATSHTDCRHGRRKHVDKPHKHPKLYLMLNWLFITPSVMYLRYNLLQFIQRRQNLFVPSSEWS